MKFAEDSVKMPDMSQNPALAGKTVYTCGRNVYYDELGYAVMSWDPRNKRFVGTTRSVPQQPKEDALAGKPWTPDYGDLEPWPWEDDFKRHRVEDED